MALPPIDVLVVTGGHPFEAEPFFAAIDSIPDVSWTSATRPALGHDVVLFYDMPGLTFTRSDPPVVFTDPTPLERQVYADLAAAGTGLVFLHHAIAGWPTWPEFAELLGGRFHYQPARLREIDFPDSGYRFEVQHTVEVLETGHPVCAGLPEQFVITDELYCFPVFEDDVEPLMRTTYPVDDWSNFSSADLAIRGKRHSNDGWQHPAGSALVAWTKQVAQSRLVYLQFGDGAVTYCDLNYRTVLANAVHWTAQRS